MKSEDLFHTGIVVDDFEETLERLSATCGYRWCEEIKTPAEITDAAGSTTEVESNFCYSRDEPRLEIIRAVPGTIWEPTPSGIHHLGYWSDDVAADCAALEAQGYARETYGGSAESPMFAYHRGPSGPRIEILARFIQPMFEQYWETGKNPFV